MKAAKLRESELQEQCLKLVEQLSLLAMQTEMVQESDARCQIIIQKLETAVQHGRDDMTDLVAAHQALELDMKMTQMQLCSAQQQCARADLEVCAADEVPTPENLSYRALYARCVGFLVKFHYRYPPGPLPP